MNLTVIKNTNTTIKEVDIQTFRPFIAEYRTTSWGDRVGLSNSFLIKTLKEIVVIGKNPYDNYQVDYHILDSRREYHGFSYVELTDVIVKELGSNRL